MEAWSKLTFGQYKGKTLPQIIWNDPDYFFWAIDKKVFSNRGILNTQAENLYRKARNIKIPAGFIVEYVIHPSSDKFSHFEIIPEDRPHHQGSSGTLRKSFIDISVPRMFAPYDKLGCKHLIICLKRFVFGDGPVRLTQKRCEAFFEDESNFA